MLHLSAEPKAPAVPGFSWPGCSALPKTAPCALTQPECGSSEKHALPFRGKLLPVEVHSGKSRSRRGVEVESRVLKVHEPSARQGFLPQYSAWDPAEQSGGICVQPQVSALSERKI